MNLKHDMNSQDNLFDLIQELQEKVEILEERCLGYKYYIQELELNVRELQRQIQAVDDRIDILKGDDECIPN